MVVGGGAKILGNITVGKNCRIGAGSVVLRNVPDNSTVVGVPGHIVFREGKRVVITDPKQINDPLSEALASVATEVNKLRERVQQLEGSEARARAATRIAAENHGRSRLPDLAPRSSDDAEFTDLLS